MPPPATAASAPLPATQHAAAAPPPAAAQPAAVPPHRGQRPRLSRQRPRPRRPPRQRHPRPHAGLARILLRTQVHALERGGARAAEVEGRTPLGESAARPAQGRLDVGGNALRARRVVLRPLAGKRHDQRLLGPRERHVQKPARLLLLGGRRKGAHGRAARPRARAVPPPCVPAPPRKALATERLPRALRHERGLLRARHRVAPVERRVQGAVHALQQKPVGPRAALFQFGHRHQRNSSPCSHARS